MPKVFVQSFKLFSHTSTNSHVAVVQTCKNKKGECLEFLCSILSGTSDGIKNR